MKVAQIDYFPPGYVRANGGNVPSLRGAECKRMELFLAAGVVAVETVKEGLFLVPCSALQRIVPA